MDYKILPGKGLDQLEFGMSQHEVAIVMGEPEAKDSDIDQGFRFDMWMYPDRKITLFFEGDLLPTLTSIETTSQETQLFGQRIFEMNEDEIMALMEKNKISGMEKENENWGEYRISYEDVMIDFYFKNHALCTVNWSIVAEEEEDE